LAHFSGLVDAPHYGWQSEIAVQRIEISKRFTALLATELANVGVDKGIDNLVATGINAIGGVAPPGG